jgi:SAM-dependent methyltransferase
VIVAVAARAEVERFVRETKPSGYMAVPLPHGLCLAGDSRARAVELVFSKGVVGKRLLDVGTYYGFYPGEAMRRGAKAAVGVEMDAERFAIARQIASLWGDSYEIRQGRAEELRFSEPFDVVLFLNVLHHVLDPIATVAGLAKLSREYVVIEFCLPSDPALLNYVGGDSERPSSFEKLRARVYSFLLRALPSSIPLMAVGPRAYHRTFYFTPAAFRNLFVAQHRMFESVEFHAGVTAPRRVVAFCRVPRAR